MNWDKGYSALYYMTRVDPATWRDVERIEITGGSIKREKDGLMQSADIGCINYSPGIEQWIRVYLVANQTGDTQREALFTGLATSPDGDYTARGRMENQLQCYSVLKPADDIYLQRGWYAQTGLHGALIIQRLLSVCPAPVEIAEEESPMLEKPLIAEDNETNLTMAAKILETINWRIRISGDGRIYIEPYPTTASATFDPLEFDVIEPQIKISDDWYECPNVFRAVYDDMTGIARDEDPASMLSIPTRGREVWMTENNVELAKNETIAQYAVRRLKEEQRHFRTAEYDRRYIPELMPGDLINMHYPEQGLDGLFEIESQGIDLGHGARTAEKIIGA